MSNPTTPFSWIMPTASDLVTDLPADFAVFGQAVATSMQYLLGGTTGQILSKTSATDMAFTWINNDQGDITAVNVTSPITGGGTSGAVTVAIQDALTTQKGAVQLSDSTSTTSSILASTPTATKASYDLAAAAIPKSTVTTNGDLIYGTGSGTVTRLGIGSSAQVLTVAGGVPSWAAAATGGMTLISTTSLSGATVTLSSIPGTYTNLYLLVYGMTNATGDGAFRIAPNASTTLTTMISQENINNRSSALGYYVPSLNDTVGRTNANNVFAITFNSYAGTAHYKPIQSSGSYVNGAATNPIIMATGAYLANTAITSLVLSNAGGNLSTGTALLYGVK